MDFSATGTSLLLSLFPSLLRSNTLFTPLHCAVYSKKSFGTKLNPWFHSIVYSSRPYYGTDHICESILQSHLKDVGQLFGNDNNIS